LNERTTYNSLDLGKFICAILIILLHTAPFASYSSVLTYGFRNIISVVAVPFFFMTSGFLFFAKANTLTKEEQQRYIIKYLKRLGVMYLIWTAVYFPFVLYGWMHNGATWIDVLQYVKRFFFEGSYSTIWFLPALMTAVATVYLLSRKLKMDTIVWIAIPFYLFACMGSSYYGLAKGIPVLRELVHGYYAFFGTVKNGLLFGFLYVTLGGWLAKKKVEVSQKRLLWQSVILFLLLTGETVLQTVLRWSSKGVDIKLVLAPLSVVLFVAILSVKLSDAPIYVWMRKMSLLLFLSQRIFISLFDLFLSNTILVTNSMLYCVCVLLLTIGFSYGFIRISNKMPWLKKFY